jgi:hypothetical protein
VVVACGSEGVKTVKGIYLVNKPTRPEIFAGVVGAARWLYGDDVQVVDRDGAMRVIRGGHPDLVLRRWSEMRAFLVAGAEAIRVQLPSLAWYLHLCFSCDDQGKERPGLGPLSGGGKGRPVLRAKVCESTVRGTPGGGPRRLGERVEQPGLFD